MRAAVVTPTGAVLGRTVWPTPHDRPCAQVLVELIGCSPVVAGAERAVIGLPGRVDHAGGRLELALDLPPGWVASLTPPAVPQALGMEVALADDADLAAVGQYHFGAGRGAGDTAYVTSSTGVGCGVVLDGRLLRGRRSLAEVGHTVLDSAAHDTAGTAGAMASGTALSRHASARGLASDAKAVLALAATDPAAAAAWQITEAAACATVVDLSHLFCPDRVVIGGGLGLNAPGLAGATAAAVHADGPRLLPTPITVCTAQLGDDAGLAGAGAWKAAIA